MNSVLDKKRLRTNSSKPERENQADQATCCLKQKANAVKSNMSVGKKRKDK